jgi:hypothetical protein
MIPESAKEPVDMRRVVDFVISIGLGWLVALGIAALVGWALPAALYPIFFILGAG